MSGLFSTNTVVILKHIFGNIFITNCRLFIVDAFCLKCLVKSHIWHNSCNYGISIQFSLRFQEFTADIQNLVSIDDISLMVYCNATVGISIICKTNIQSVIHHIFLKYFNMRGSTCSVDVCSIRIIVNDVSFCTQSVKNTLCDRRRTSVGAIQTNFDIFEIAAWNGNQVSNITISSRWIVYRTANLITIS